MLDRVSQKLLVLVFCVFPLSCSTAEDPLMTARDFDELCGVYEDVARQPLEFAVRESLIVEHVQEKWPRFFKRYFVKIMDISRSDRYQTIKRIAVHELAEASVWDCEIMNDYYDGKFDVTNE